MHIIRFIKVIFRKGNFMISRKDTRINKDKILKKYSFILHFKDSKERD